jgi:extradiol dioxygenase family protein
MKLSTLLIVADLVEARKFYVDVMGLSIVHESEERLHLKADGHEIHIFEGENNAKPYSHSADASSTLVFWVEDLALKMSELESLGIKFIHSNENQYSKYAAFWGPSGIVHELSEARI